MSTTFLGDFEFSCENSLDPDRRTILADMNPNLLVHVADLHLAPRTSTIAKRDPVTNRLIRDLDMTASLRHAVDDVLAQNPLPSAFVIAGDLFDTNQASQDAIIDMAGEIQRIRDAGIE